MRKTALDSGKAFSDRCVPQSRLPEVLIFLFGVLVMAEWLWVALNGLPELFRGVTSPGFFGARDEATRTLLVEAACRGAACAVAVCGWQFARRRRRAAYVIAAVTVPIVVFVACSVLSMFEWFGPGQFLALGSWLFSHLIATELALRHRDMFR